MEQMGRWSERARERFEGSQGRDILSAGLQGGRIGAGRGTSWERREGDAGRDSGDWEDAAVAVALAAAVPDARLEGAPALMVEVVEEEEDEMVEVWWW